MTVRAPAARTETTIGARRPRLRFFGPSGFEKALDRGEPLAVSEPFAGPPVEPLPDVSLPVPVAENPLPGPARERWLDQSLDGGENRLSRRQRCGGVVKDVCEDYKNYYRWRTMRDLAYGLAAGSVLANTSLDEDFQDWYRADVRGSWGDDFASFTNTFGEGKIFIPAYAGLAAVSLLAWDRPSDSVIGDFSWRTTRGYLVGAPPVLFTQFLLGASRPKETASGSHWKPFDDVNAVSGHAFVGAVPFLTAANMVDNKLLKGGLYLGSTFTAWARLNNDRHYLSQVCLGWWMAYLACRSVDGTDQRGLARHLVPVTTPEMVGIGVAFQR